VQAILVPASLEKLRVTPLSGKAADQRCQPPPAADLAPDSANRLQPHTRLALAGNQLGSVLQPCSPLRAPEGARAGSGFGR